MQQDVESLDRKITAHCELVVSVPRNVGKPMLETKTM